MAYLCLARPLSWLQITRVLLAYDVSRGLGLLAFDLSYLKLQIARVLLAYDVSRGLRLLDYDLSYLKLQIRRVLLAYDLSRPRYSHLLAHVAKESK